MALSIGIVGLPNVGKSTLFNALTKAQNAQAANYPFCTIEPNKAIVPVPDPRLDMLTELVKPQNVQSATVEFTDIAGLVRGASQGEGLGNKFLANIRETRAILHVCRCFVDEDVVHVHGVVDPVADVEVIETELLLADVQTVEKAVDRLRKASKTGKDGKTRHEFAEDLLARLNRGELASSFDWPAEGPCAGLRVEMSLLTDKPVILVANVDEAGLSGDNEQIKAARALAEGRGWRFVKVAARLEEELVGLSDEEAAEFLSSYGLSEPGLNEIIRQGYEALGLISYFTAGVKEVRAWTINRGDKAPRAAAAIHTDFERGFIRAEVIAYNDYVKCKTEAACRAAGVLRAEGKEYVVADGDVIHFLFNV